MKCNFIHLDKFPNFPKIDSVYIVRGTVLWHNIMYYSDGTASCGGSHEWTVGVCPSREIAERKVAEIETWLNVNLGRFKITPPEKYSKEYMVNNFECPMDSGILNFVTRPQPDTHYSFDRPTYGIQESTFIR